MHAALSLAVVAGLCAGCGSRVDCRRRPDCPVEGRCATSTVRAGDLRCYAGSAADCAAAEVCRREGRCALGPDGTCVKPEQVVDARTARPPDSYPVAIVPLAPTVVTIPVSLPRHQIVEIRCGTTTLHGLAPREWSLEAAPESGEARWTIPSTTTSAAWVVGHCIPPGPVDLATLDAWYGLFRLPDGAPLPEVGRGHAGLSSTCGRRVVSIRTRATLVERIAGVPLGVPAPDVALERAAIEAPGATVLLDLVGAPAVVESAKADWNGLVDGMRLTPSTVEEAHRRPCP